jgi:hypothetical protein
LAAFSSVKKRMNIGRRLGQGSNGCFNQDGGGGLACPDFPPAVFLKRLRQTPRASNSR